MIYGILFVVYLKSNVEVSKVDLPENIVGDRYLWTGSVKDGKGHGRGKLIVEGNGRVVARFKGTLTYGTLEKGKLRTDAWEYKGEFKNGLRDGTGVCDWPDMRYEGTWASDLFWGEGKLVMKERKSFYKGHFKEGVPHGKGAIFMYVLTAEAERGMENELVRENIHLSASSAIHEYRCIKSGVWDEGVFVVTGGEE